MAALFQCGAVMWSKQCWSVHLAHPGLHTREVMIQGFDLPSLPCSGSKQPFPSSSRTESRLPSAILSHTSPPINQGTYLPCVRLLGWNAQSVALTIHSPVQVSTRVISIFLWVPSQQHQSWPDYFFSLPSQLCVYLSYSLICIAVFMPVFSENCFTCRYIFHVFVGGGEFCIFLLPHLDLSSLLIIL